MIAIRCYLEDMRLSISLMVGVALLALSSVAHAGAVPAGAVPEVDVPEVDVAAQDPAAPKPANLTKSVSRTPARIQVVPDTVINLRPTRPLVAVAIERLRPRNPLGAMNQRLVGRIGRSVYNRPF